MRGNAAPACAPAPLAIVSAMARPNPEPSAAVWPRSKRRERRLRVSGGTGGPPLVTRSTPSRVSATRTGSSTHRDAGRFRSGSGPEWRRRRGPCRTGSHPRASGPRSGRSRRLPARNSSTTMPRTGAISIARSARSRPPSALASCISFSDRRARRLSAASMSRARSRAAPRRSRRSGAGFAPAPPRRGCAVHVRRWR